jgi:hypothetical protein
MPEQFDINAFTTKLRALIAGLPEKETLAGLRPARLNALKSEIEAAIILLQTFSRQLDPVSHPPFVFDAPKTRANRRSPWDTLHPGRKWATTSDNVPNEKSVKQILGEIAGHFAKFPPVRQPK